MFISIHEVNALLSEFNEATVTNVIKWGVESDYKFGVDMPFIFSKFFCEIA
jgi:hypothetical protein